MELCVDESQKEVKRCRKEDGEVLKRYRTERGVTRIELSERTGVDREDIERTEKGALGLSEAEKKRIFSFLQRQKIL